MVGKILVSRKQFPSETGYECRKKTLVTSSAIHMYHIGVIKSLLPPSIATVINGKRLYCQS